MFSTTFTWGFASVQLNFLQCFRSYRKHYRSDMGKKIWEVISHLCCSQSLGCKARESEMEPDVIMIEATCTMNAVCLNHSKDQSPTPTQPMEKLSPTKPVPAARKLETAGKHFCTVNSSKLFSLYLLRVQGEFELFLFAEFISKVMEWNQGQKSLSAQVLKRGCPEGSSGAGRQAHRAGSNCVCPGALCVALSKSFRVSCPLTWQEYCQDWWRNSEITVQYLKILGRKMRWYKSKSFLISVLIMQTSFFSSSYKVFFHLSWRSHCSPVSTGEITLLATLLSTCSRPGTVQRPKDTAAMTDTILQAGLCI